MSVFQLVSYQYFIACSRLSHRFYFCRVRGSEKEASVSSKRRSRIRFRKFSLGPLDSSHPGVFLRMGECSERQSCLAGEVDGVGVEVVRSDRTLWRVLGQWLLFCGQQR